MQISPTLRRTLLIAVLALAAAAAMSATASASVLWNSDAERPWDQEWASMSCQDSSRVQEVTSPVAQGHSAYRMEVRDGDNSYGERCELGQGNPTRNGYPLYHEGDERWISFQTYLPDDYPVDATTWNVILQLKQLGALGTPAVSMEVERGKFILMNSDTNHESSGCNWWWQGPATRNHWNKFTMHVKFSPNDSVGFIELYGDLDGTGVKQLMPRTYMHTMKVDATGATVPSHSRIGLYRNPAITGTAHIYFDGYTIGDDRASVEAAAFGTASTVAPPPPPPTDTTSGTTSGTTTSGTTTTAGSGKGSGTKKGGRKHRKRKARVWIRIKRHGLRAAAVHGFARWGEILPVYGGVRGRHAKNHTVVIEIRRHGRWEWLTRGWLRRNGRFYLSPAVTTGRRHVVKLRAVVSGLGHSRTLRTRVR